MRLAPTFTSSFAITSALLWLFTFPVPCLSLAVATKGVIGIHSQAIEGRWQQRQAIGLKTAHEGMETSEQFDKHILDLTSVELLETQVELGQGEVPARNSGLTLIPTGAFERFALIKLIAVRSEQGRLLLLLFGLAILIGGAALALFFVTWSGASALTRDTRLAIHEFNKDGKGFGLSAESISVNHCTGHMEVRGLEVLNPVGYETPTLLRCDRITLDVDLLAYAWSQSERMIVRQVRAEHVDVIYEKGQPSNVQQVLEIIEQLQAKKKLDEQSGASQPADRRCIQIRDMLVEDMGGRVIATMFHGRGLRHNLGGLHIPDFDLEMGPATPEELGAELTKRILKVVLKQLAARNISDKFL